MAADELFPDWHWEDPDGLAPTMAAFTESLARCETLAAIGDELPKTGPELRALGITGIEFARFRTEHPAGLGTDLVAVHTEDAHTEPGRLYLVDGRHRFTQLDIARPLPFADNTFDWVYAEHLIEHVPLPVSIGWLTEVRRVLAPAGLLRLTTPDLRRYVEGYLTEDKFFARHRRRLAMLRVGPAMPARRAFMVNQIFYHYGHKWIFDFAELCYALGEAGFDPDAVRQCAFREGGRPDVAELDTTMRADETIYVEVTA